MENGKKNRLLKYSPEMKDLLNLYIDNFGNADIHVFRIPARINLLGTHIEHRGGYVNYLAIDKELLCVAGKRNDGQIKFCNLDRQYENGEFSINGEMPDGKVEWLDFIRKTKTAQGDWGNYIKASVLYLQNKFRGKQLSGMNLAFFGKIPVGSGLSSSSAVIVGTMLAFCAINGIAVKKDSLALMCGEAEWYVGTRGGSGDHAAMLFGGKNRVAHMRFFPFTNEFLPFPDNYSIICCNSLIEAKKSVDAKNIFNERIACYEIGLRLIKKNFPELANELSYLRDINPRKLGSEKTVYELLLSLPESISRKDIAKRLPDENLDFLFESHQAPRAGYRLRDVVLYGISECERSRICSKFLQNMDMRKFGKLMLISHDGDRIVSHLPDGKKAAWNFKTSDKYLLNLIENLDSACPETREKARLYNQPGAYRCSTEELDLIVDAVKKVKGVSGAKLTGAGLGGTVLILAEKSATDKVMDVLRKKYYAEKGLPESAFICNSVSGAGEL